MLKLVTTYYIISITLALVTDLTFKYFNLFRVSIMSFLWGFTRMWCPTIAVLITSLILEKKSFKDFVNDYVGFSDEYVRRIVSIYLLAPIISILSVAYFIGITKVLNIFSTEKLVHPLTMYGVEITLPPYMYMILMIFYGYFAAITINLIFALGEEIGWRGFLQTKLQEKLDFIKSCIVVGILWSIWHFSAIFLLNFNYRYEKLIGSLLFTILCIEFSIILGLIRNYTRSSIPCASLHGSINGIYTITLVVTNLSPRLNEVLGGLGLLGIVTWFLTVMTLLLVKVFVKKLLR